MKTKTKMHYFIFAITIGLIVSIILLIIMFSTISATEIKDYQRERISVMQRFLRFQTEAEISINESVYLLEGYLAYIETVPHLSEKESEKYITRLLLKQEHLIRNIGLIKDTTIFWNFPREGNEKAIGIDLATIEEQRNDVLFVKKDLKPVFVGPIDLYQGGKGFIVRIPVVRDEKYWGQISIVLDSEKYFDYISSIANQANLNVAVYKKDFFPNNPIYGDKSILDRKGLELDVEIMNKNWVVVAEPSGGWNDSAHKIFLQRIIAIIVSLICGGLMYSILYTKGQLKYQAFNDSLTGLNNRHALKEYYNKVYNTSEKIIKSFDVIMLDIDRFKVINDTHGHDVGDMVLKQFSNKLNSISIDNKRVFRVGGDEFLIIANHVDKKISSEISVDSLRSEISFVFESTNPKIRVIPSIGIAQYPKDSNNLEKVVLIADNRMYEDKEKRR